MWGFTSAFLKKQKHLQWSSNRPVVDWAEICECVCMCARWISSSKSLSCYYLLCEKNLWEHQQKRQYQQFHTKDQITELRAQKPLCWMKTNAYAQHHISKATQTCTNRQQAHAHHMQSQSMEGITIFFPLSQIRQDQIISLLWCQFSAV